MFADIKDCCTFDPTKKTKTKKIMENLNVNFNQLIEVLQLVSEYKADPNCRPDLWISSESVNQDQKDLFVKLCKPNA